MCDRRALGLLFSAFALSCHAEPCKPILLLGFPSEPPHAYRQKPPGRGDRIAVIGDTQRTSLEGCMLGNEVNDQEQRALLADLGRQESVSTVLLLGDMVFLGDSPIHWAYFDYLMSVSKVGEKSLFPLLGNHEYLFAGKAPDLSNVRARFAVFGSKRTYYAFTWGEVRMILLDSNHERLRPDVFDAEMKWLACELCAVDQGSARAAIVFAHQSPYTQSPWAPSDAVLQRETVPLFCASARKIAFISAHAHGYERWTNVPVPGCREDHTPFIVSAGGGGPRPPDRRSDSPEDAAAFHEWPRPFNYLVLSQSTTGVHVETHVLRKGGTCVSVAPEETEELPFSTSAPAAGSCACEP